VSPAEDQVRRLFQRALARVAPAGPTERALAGLDLADSIVLLALGKAAAGMAAGAEAALGQRIAARVVVAPPGSGPGITHPGSHPVPDARSEAAGRALLAAAAGARPDQDVVALISGGGSALAAVPAAGLALADKAEAIARLMAAGAAIGELNCVRRHLSAIKGGRLAAASPARVTTLVVSDVVGDALHEVASGPTVPDPTLPADARAVVARYLEDWGGVGVGTRKRSDSLPESVIRRLADDGAPPPARAGDRAFLLLGLGALVDAAAAEARADGFTVEVAERMEGPVEGVAAALARRIRTAPVLVAGGEPTVALSAEAGRSGRAHHLALLLARDLAAGEREVAVLVAGSDGVDGVSGAAGAVVDRHTWGRIRAAGLDPDAHLARFDAAAALAAVGAQIVTGPTGVNHADLVIACSASALG
jgi:glycerate 2-kinase